MGAVVARRLPGRTARRIAANTRRRELVTSQRLRGYILLASAAIVLLGCPIAYHAINVLEGANHDGYWLIGGPVAGFLLMFVGLLIVRGPEKRRYVAVAAVAMTLVLCVIGLVLLLGIGVVLTFAGTPGYDLP